MLVIYALKVLESFKDQVHIGSRELSKGWKRSPESEYRQETLKTIAAACSNYQSAPAQKVVWST
jgi:hypothetical protein